MAPSDPVAGDATPENTLNEVDAATMPQGPGPRPGGLPDAPPERGTHVSHVHDGKSLTLLEHSHNANPQSMEAALKTPAGWPVAEGGARIAVLSDMREPGTQETANSRLVADIIARGPPRDVAGVLIDALLPLADTGPPEPETYQVTLYGKVQGVGYRRWLWTQAPRR